MSFGCRPSLGSISPDAVFCGKETMYRLILFGGISLQGPSGPLSGRVVQRRQLALLSLLACSRPTPLGREKAVGLLWGDSPEPRARRRLSDALYVLRQELGEEAVLPFADRMRLNPEAVWSDVAAFDEAADAGRERDAVKLYAGPFLDGFHAGEAAGFERWIDQTRQRFAMRYRKALETLAEAAEAEGDWVAAARRWKERAGEAPTNPRVTLRLMRALAAGGNVPHALEQARIHEILCREELDLPLAEGVRALADELARGRRGPSSDAQAPGSGPGAEAPGEQGMPEGIRGEGPEPDGTGSAFPPTPPSQSPAPRRWTAPGAALASASLVVAVLAAAWFLGAGREDEPTPAIVVFDESEGEGEALEQRATEDPEAYDHFLQGNAHLARQFSRSGVHAAIDQYERAVARDPAFTEAWRRLIHARLWLVWVHDDVEEGMRARDEVARLTSMDPDDPEVRLARGWYLYYGERRYREALREFEAVVAHRPGDVEVLRVIGFVEQRLGRWDAALATKKEALQRSPRDAELHYAVASALRWAGRPDDAIAYYERAIALTPREDAGFLHANMEPAYLELGDTLRAREARERARELGAESRFGGRDELYGRDYEAAALRVKAKEPTSPMQRMYRYDNLADIHGRLGDAVPREVYADSLLALASALAPQDWDRPRASGANSGWIYSGLALIHLGDLEAGVRHVRRGLAMEASFDDALGEPFLKAGAARAFVRAGLVDEAIDLLEVVRSTPWVVLAHDLIHDSEWDPLRGHPRFERLLERG